MVPGSTRELPARTVALAPKRSEPVKRASTSRPANRKRMALIGRTESWARLASQQAMPASSSAADRAKNSLTSSSRPWPSLAETSRACRHQWPGGASDPGPSAQYSAIALCSSVSPALSASTSSAWNR